MPKPTDHPAKPNSATSRQFAARLTELEGIAAWFESDNIDLDQGLAKFEQGMELVAELRDYLQSAQNRVEQITKKFDQPKARSPQAAIEPEPATTEAADQASDDLGLFD